MKTIKLTGGQNFNENNFSTDHYLDEVSIIPNQDHEK